MQTATGKAYRASLESKQQALKSQLRSRAIPVTGAVSTVLNAVFVSASDDRKPELEKLPGVRGVVKLRVFKARLNTAIEQMNGSAAWAALGGMSNAGQGMRIAILDTGVESTHAAFQDSSLPMPDGFPRCGGGNFDCSKFTNNKVIVARSYVSMMAAGSGADPSLDSRPDDYTPRDRFGHGTGTASCAAGASNKGLVTFSGMAPKAYIGNYKVTGSPMVNEGAPEDVTIQAAEDAYNDGMNVISYSFGAPALTGALETGAICGNAAGVPCDPLGTAFENLTKRGIIIVAAAGNEGNFGFNTVDSPGNAPSVIAVGALTNIHTFAETMSVVGGPSELQNVTVDLSDGSPFEGAVTAPLRDVAQVGDNGYACSSIPVGYLNGTIALIAWNPQSCGVSTKIWNAVDAGAIGAVIYGDSNTFLVPGGFANKPIPAVFVSSATGLALKNYAAANPGAQVIIDPNAIEQPYGSGNRVASFSSKGPAAGAFKPDVLATGTDIYMAAQTYDPYGFLYSSTGYAAASGTSFATPIVAGAAALVKQKHPDWTPDQVKSAIVDTASQDISGTPTVLTAGAGKLDAAAAVNSTVTVVPPNVSFDVLQASTTLPITRSLQITNTGSGAVVLNAAVSAAVAPRTGGAVTLDKAALSLGAGQSGTITVVLSGPVPSAAGVYSGAVTLQGSGVFLRVPYMFAVGSGAPSVLIPLVGADPDGFTGTVGQTIDTGILAVKAIDANGVPVPNAPVSWTPTSTPPAVVLTHDSVTDANGVAGAQIQFGSDPGAYNVMATVSRFVNYRFSGWARSVPTTDTASVQNAGDFQTAIAPGSYIAIKGTDLADSTDLAYTTHLPISIDYTAVSFDNPSAGLSIAAPITYVSPTQVNAQVPWEFQGVDSARVKVRIDYTNGNVVTVPLKAYAPALFQVGGGAAAAQLQKDYSLITLSNPASRGQGIILYANGLGPVTNQPATGEPALADALSRTTTIPVVMIGGKQAEVGFSGLTPGLAALYQLNVTVPPDAPTGAQPVTIAIGGVTSSSATIAIQ